jgi:parvulin-like peptidyl-prolyl isomerase
LAVKTAWKVNGWLIRSADIRAEASALRQGADLSIEERLALSETALESLIERAMLRTSAHRLGFTPTGQEIEAALARLAPRNDGVTGCRAGMASAENLEDIRHRLAVDKMMHSCIDKVKRPQAWQVAEFYRKNPTLFWTPELVHAWHLVKNFDESLQNESEARASIERMRERVQNGEDFVTVAEEASDCRELGGDLGYFARGTMVDEFDNVVFAAPVGELTPVFRTRFGLHIAIVKDRKAAGIRALEEVEPEIENMLLRQAQDAACGELLAKLQKSAKIEQVTE